MQDKGVRGTRSFCYRTQWRAQVYALSQADFGHVVEHLASGDSCGSLLRVMALAITAVVGFLARERVRVVADGPACRNCG